MASYTELFNLHSDQELKNRVVTAIVIKAQSLIDGTPTVAQVAWAIGALANPVSRANDILHYVLAVNKAATTTQIKDADDATLQGNVNSAVDVIISGGT